MIPYENGWTVSVDGEEVETEKGDLGFLAFPVKEGEHQLTITFHAPGLKGRCRSEHCVLDHLFRHAWIWTQKKEKGSGKLREKFIENGI